MKFRFDVAMSGRLGVELQPSDIADSEVEFVKNAIKTYKDTIRPIVQFRDLYCLHSPYNDNGWASQMHVSKDKKEAVCFLYSLKMHILDRHVAKFKGLDPNVKYTLVELNKSKNSNSSYTISKTFSGDFLMKYGIPFRVHQPFQSAVVLLKEEHLD